MKKLVYLLLIVGLCSAGCTDAQRSRITSYGSSAKIQCYSGGKLIYDGTSTGKVVSEENSDGYYFREKDTNRLLEVSGNCILEYGK